MNSILNFISNLDQVGKKVARLGIVIVFLWIGSLKFFTYEADGIVPFVANSPLISFFYSHAGDYKNHVNKEGEFIAANHKWHEENNTYLFSKWLGVFLITIAVLVALHSIVPLASVFGSILVALVTLGTLSFLLTTPECWVPHINDEQWGFPYLSSRGRLVVKDLVILGASIVTMSESARLYLMLKEKKRNELIK